MILYQLHGTGQGASTMRRVGLKQGAYKRRSDPEPWIVLGDIALNENRMAEAELDFAKAN